MGDTTGGEPGPRRDCPRASEYAVPTTVRRQRAPRQCARPRRSLTIGRRARRRDLLHRTAANGSSKSLVSLASASPRCRTERAGDGRGLSTFWHQSSCGDQCRRGRRQLRRRESPHAMVDSPEHDRRRLRGPGRHGRGPQAEPSRLARGKACGLGQCGPYWTHEGIDPVPVHVDRRAGRRGGVAAPGRSRSGPDLGSHPHDRLVVEPIASCSLGHRPEGGAWYTSTVGR